MSLRNGVLSSRTMAAWSLAAVFLLGTGSLSLQAQEYTPLPGLRVSNGQIQYSFFRAGGCINLSNTTLNGVVYTVHTSKWQRREGATWVDIPGTEHDGGVCAYSTTTPGEYRLVGEISIGGERGFYSSENTFTVAGMTPEEMMPPPVTGGPTYYFPHLAVGAGWQTTITYINYSSEEVTCQTDFLADDGSALMVSFADRGTGDSRTDTLPPGGSVHQETNVTLSAPLAGGWARAICTGPVKASLLFRQHDSAGVAIAEAGVNAATVPATRFVTFAEQGEGQPGTGVGYANPSDTEADITFRVRAADGEVLASVTQELSAGGHGAQNMAGLFDLTSFSGWLEVTSTAPIVSLSINAEADSVFSSLPPGELDAAAQGETTYYFPHLAVGAGWQTTITYINYSSEEVSCQTDFLSDQGTPLLVSFPGVGTVVDRTDPLPPGGSVHEETDVALSAPLVGGWARATCTGPVKASLLFREHDSEGVATGEAGVNATTVPATRFVTFAEQGEGKPGTGVGYANPSDTSALVTFTARAADGEMLARVDKTLLPNGHGAQNMALLFGLSSFTGWLEVTSTEPIVSLSINAEADSVFSSLPPGELDAGSGGTAITRTSFESSTPEGYTAVTLATGGRVWGVPARYTSDSDPGTVAYMLLGELKGCDFANAEADRRSKVYIKTQSLGTLNDYESKTVCRKTSSRWLTSWSGVRITLMLFFDESSPSNTREAAYNETTEEYSIDTSTIPGGSNNFEVGDTLPGVPTAGQLFPVSGWATEWSGVTFSGTAGNSTTYLTFDDGGYITLKTGTRYTCQATGGCRVGNGVISRGTMVGSGGTTAPQPGNQGASIPRSPSVTTRVSPSQLIVGQRAEFILNWNEVAGATSYKVRVSQFAPILFTRNPNGSCTVPSSVTTNETSYTYEFTASFQNQLYYTVQACNSAGCSCPPG